MNSLLDTNAAATLLNSSFPESPGYWRRYLVNNRRADRNPRYRIHTGAGHAPRYKHEDILGFIAWEKERRLMKAVGPARARDLIAAYGRSSMVTHQEDSPGTLEILAQARILDERELPGGNRVYMATLDAGADSLGRRDFIMFVEAGTGTSFIVEQVLAEQA